MTIRPMMKADVRPASEMLAKRISVDADREPSIFEPMNDIDSNAKYLESIIDSPSFCLLVAEEGGNVAGYLIGYKRRAGTEASFLRKSDVFWIDDLQVSSAFRHRGVGGALIVAAQRHAKSAGCSRIELDVFESNDGGIAFYKRLGFRSQKRTMVRSC